MCSHRHLALPVKLCLQPVSPGVPFRSAPGRFFPMVLYFRRVPIASVLEFARYIACFSRGNFAFPTACISPCSVSSCSRTVFSDGALFPACPHCVRPQNSTRSSLHFQERGELCFQPVSRRDSIVLLPDGFFRWCFISGVSPLRSS